MIGGVRAGSDGPDVRGRKLSTPRVDGREDGAEGGPSFVEPLALREEPVPSGGVWESLPALGGVVFAVAGDVTAADACDEL